MEARKAAGKQIELARRMKNWSQKDLAENFHTNQATISRMERGAIKIDFYDLSELASILGKPISFFYEPFDSSAASPFLEHKEPDKGKAGARGKPAVPHSRAGKRSAA